MAFLKSLSGLHSEVDSVKNGEKPQLRERVAAARLFNWEVLACLIPHGFLSLVNLILYPDCIWKIVSGNMKNA